jgi:protein transport protein SEC13
LVTVTLELTQQVWQLNEVGEAKKVVTLSGHSDWVRDVAWAPNAGLPYSTVASCGQDGLVNIWTQTDNPQNWTQLPLPKFPSPVWRVSWSVTGNILAVSCGDNTVTLWKEFIDQGWKCISTLNEDEKDNE